MKTIMILTGILLLFTASAFAELSVEDFEKIRTLLREEISAVETLTEKMTATETHLKGYITQEIEKVNVKIGEMDKRLTGEISNMDKRLDQTFTLVVVLITAVIAVVGVPMTIILFQLSRPKNNAPKMKKLKRCSSSWKSKAVVPSSHPNKEKRNHEKNIRTR